MPSRDQGITDAQAIRGVGITPGPPSPSAVPGIPQQVQGDLLVGGKIKWKSGRAFVAALVHAITAARTYTFPDASGNVPALPTEATTETGTGDIVRATSPTIATPTIADLSNMQHTHESAAQGGGLKIKPRFFSQATAPSTLDVGELGIWNDTSAGANYIIWCYAPGSIQKTLLS